jgi:hypothetical protein
MLSKLVSLSILSILFDPSLFSLLLSVDCSDFFLVSSVMLVTDVLLLSRQVFLFVLDLVLDLVKISGQLFSASLSSSQSIL